MSLFPRNDPPVFHFVSSRCPFFCFLLFAFCSHLDASFKTLCREPKPRRKRHSQTRTPRSYEQESGHGQHNDSSPATQCCIFFPSRKRAGPPTSGGGHTVNGDPPSLEAAKLAHCIAFGKELAVMAAGIKSRDALDRVIAHARVAAETAIKVELQCQGRRAAAGAGGGWAEG